MPYGHQIATCQCFTELFWIFTYTAAYVSGSNVLSESDGFGTGVNQGHGRPWFIRKRSRFDSHHVVLRPQGETRQGRLNNPHEADEPGKVEKESR